MKKALGSLLLMLLLFLAGSALGEISTNLRKDTVTNPLNKKVASETYVDHNGNPVIADDKGYCTIRYSYDSRKRVEKIELLDENGQRINGRDGYAVCQYTYSYRQQLGLAYYTADGQPATGPQGFHREENRWQDNKYHISTWHYDTQGNPVGIHRVTEYVRIGNDQKVKSDTWYNTEDGLAAGPEGYARLEYDYEGTHISRIAYLGADGAPYLYKKAGYATMLTVYQNGRMTEESYLGWEGELIAGPKGYARIVYTYPSKDWRKEMYYNADGTLYFNSNLICGLLRKLGQRNRVVEEQYFVGEETRGNSKAGYSRVTRYYNERGKVQNERYYDAQDQAIIVPSLGYAEVHNIYHNMRDLIRTEYLGTDRKPVRCVKGYSVISYTFENRAVTEMIYLDTDGKTPVNCDEGYASVRYTNNDAGLHVRERFYDSAGLPFVTEKNADEIRYEWEGRNRISESYWQNGQAVECPDLYHKLQNVYNVSGKVIRISYSDREGMPVNCAKGYAAQENEYNSDGAVMCTRYYDARGNLVLTPGKEYAFIRTVSMKDLNLVGTDTAFALEAEEEEDGDGETEAEPDDADFGSADALTEVKADDVSASQTVSAEEGAGKDAPEGAIVEYHGTDGSLMMLAAGYAYLVRTNNDQGLVKTEAYFDTEGNPATLKAGYASLEREYDVYGRLTGESYYDAQGGKALREEGYHSYRRVNDGAGNPVTLTYWGLNGEPVMSSAGYHRIERTWKDASHATEEAWYDTEGNPQVLKDTYASIRRVFDGKGNTVSERYFGPDGKPVACNNLYDEIRREFNDQNKAVRTEYRLGGVLTLNNTGYAVMCQAYNDQGLAVSEWYLGTNEEPVMSTRGYQWVDRTYLDARHITSEAWFDADWQPVAPTDLYVRVEREFDERGNRLEERYYGADGKPAACKAGYDEIRTIYNEANQATRIEYLREGWYYALKDGYAIMERAYDEQGLVAVESYYGTDGMAVNNAKGIHRLERTWLDAKHATSEAWFDKDGKAIANGNTYVAIRREFDEAGNTLRETYHDAEGNLLACKAGYDEIQREFNGKNQAVVIRYRLAGAPFLTGDKIAEIHRSYDDAGNVASESYYGTEGEPVLHRSGYHRIDRTWLDAKHATSEAWFDTEGNPKTLNDTYVRIVRAFDDRGNAFDIVFFGPDGNTIACKAGYDEERAAFNEKNQKIYSEYYLDGAPVLNTSNAARVDREYDEAGNVSREVFYGTAGEPVLCTDGYAQRTRVFDEKKRVILEKRFNTDGSPMVWGKETYCALGTEYDENGNAAVLKYYDGDGNPVACNAGYEMIWRRFNDRKKVIYETYHNASGDPMAKSNGVYQTTYDYDEKDRVIQEQYFDAEGQLACCLSGYARVTRVYDGNGKLIEEAYFDTEGQPALRDGKYAKVVRTYGEDGKMAAETFLLPDGSEVTQPE